MLVGESAAPELLRFADTFLLICGWLMCSSIHQSLRRTLRRCWVQNPALFSSPSLPPSHPSSFLPSGRLPSPVNTSATLILPLSLCQKHQIFRDRQSSARAQQPSVERRRGERRTEEEGGKRREGMRGGRRREAAAVRMGGSRSAASPRGQGSGCCRNHCG